MQQQRGFTLIELIIVIVILGILAVTAAPKFIDIQGDATASTLQGLKAALHSGSQLVYAKSAIEGEQKNEFVAGDASSIVTIGTNDVSTHFGYPFFEVITSTTLAYWIDVSATDFIVVDGTGSAAFDSPSGAGFGVYSVNSAYVSFAALDEDANSCHVYYKYPTSKNESPIITVVTGGC